MKNYYDIACNDLKFLNAIREFDYYNNIAIQAQQISEKLLKSVCEITLLGESYRKTHNLARLFQMLAQEVPEINEQLNVMELSFLTDFYFDARYPGDDYVDVTRPMCEQCLGIMDKVVNFVKDFREQKNLDTAELNCALHRIPAELPKRNH